MNILLGYGNGVCRDFIKNNLIDEVSENQILLASTLAQSIELVADAKQIDVVAIDLNMPDVNGLSGLLRMRKVVKKDVPIGLIGSELNPEEMREALLAGAAGFLPYSMTSDGLLGALRLMAGGEIFVPVNIETGIQAAMINVQKSFLTAREQEVLDGLMVGQSNREIANHLGLSEVTIKHHLKGLRFKLGARNRTHAVLRAIELGIG